MSDSPCNIKIAPRRIRLQRIRAGSLLRFVFAISAGLFVPLILFAGVLALFGLKTISVYGEDLTGLKGLIAAILLAPIFAVVYSVLAWTPVYIGMRVWCCFKPITLEYVPAGEEMS